MINFFNEMPRRTSDTRTISEAKGITADFLEVKTGWFYYQPAKFVSTQPVVTAIGLGGRAKRIRP